ncbi:uncharacterized protein LOC133205095 [Saccostrea echinata]|uniref:uncharacterized protein LOC133205095 n=1 Tax=Saccostrea echinata TaxID=191078 RepID=UPI002A833260|nr:uncharacterized protein LOC133205095 [Saccostrea echinata]
MKLTLLSLCLEAVIVSGIYVDYGNPYKQGLLRVGQLTLSETGDGSPLHTVAFFPLEVGDYPVVYFLGGLNTYVLAELYSTVLSSIASHGFFVFGVDYQFPVYDDRYIPQKPNYGKQDIDKFFKELTWLETYFRNKTLSTPKFNLTGLLCHSSGCDISMKMIKEKGALFTSTIFLEPFTTEIETPIKNGMPALMYGTQLSEEGVKCAIPGFDYNKLYDIWSCPRVVMNVANFGHCDILDPVPWKLCHTTHFCKTTNETFLPEYRQFVQGVTSAFFVSTLQGLTKDISYVTVQNLIPFKLLELKSDITC